MKSTTQYDVIVAGSGAGGATVAREMTRRGKKVLLLERGGRMDLLGNSLTVAMALQGFGLIRSREKYGVTFGDNYGGLSVLAAGCAVPPPKEVFGPAGISLAKEAAEAKREMGIQVLPDELIGKTNLRLLDAANSAGYSWTRMEKFINPAECTGTGDCMLGCDTGAKWSARVYADEAVKNGAELLLHTRVDRVLVEDGRAVGVEARRLGRRLRLHAKAVVLSAGVDNVHILRRAGVAEAGMGFCCDWLQFVGAVIPGMNTVHDNPMAVGTLEHYEEGMAILPVFPNWSQFAILLYYMGLRNLRFFPRFWKYSGIMVKIRDDRSGEIFRGTSFSKPVTGRDRKKLDKGVAIIRKVFKKAGAREDSVIALQPFGAHPSASCRIGEVVDRNLETRISGLYCCDASVFPSSLGLPVVWTAVSLGKRLAKHLDRRLEG
jgi:choline dehydrogenase-like flavoprotein